MKQNITIEQLDELTPTGFITLEKWKVDHGYGVFPYYENGRLAHKRTMTIGHMIQFLNEHGKLDIEKKEEVTGSWFRICFGERLIDDEDELCDALWEACKEVLNYEK